MRLSCLATQVAVALFTFGAGAHAQSGSPASPPLDASSRFQVSAAVGVGMNARRDKPGVALGAFGMLRLSRTPGSVVGLPFLLSRSFSAGRSEAYMTGIHFGDTVDYQLLVGLASGTDQYALTSHGITQESNFGLAAGSALGLHLELTRSFGLNAEAFIARTFFADSPSFGILVGPTFQMHDHSGEPAPPPPVASTPRERGSHLELAWLYSRYVSLGGEQGLGATTEGPRAAVVKGFSHGLALGFGARFGGSAGGFDVTLHERFDRFTGRAVVPYVVAGPLLLFGPSASGDVLVIPRVDVLVGAGLGVEFRLTRWSAISPSVRFYHPLVTRRAYTGPIDATAVWSIDL
jgi:hypothetical protein